VSALDLYFPSLKLALEYHGPQHYLSSSVFKYSADKQASLDAQKRDRCTSVGLTLIEVPYTWQKGDVESLANTIRTQRPDLIPEVMVRLQLITDLSGEQISLFELRALGELLSLSEPHRPNQTKLSSTSTRRCLWGGGRI